jgi:hypothetical protein
MELGEIIPSGGLDALASQLGVPRDQAERGAEALLPSILGGMGDSAGGHGAPDATRLETVVQGLGGGGLADNVIGPEPTNIGKGNDILGHIFGSKEVSRQVADHASRRSGVDPALLKRMLPILAMLVAGYMAKRSGEQGGGLASILGTVLGGLAGQSSRGGAAGGLGGILGSILGGR